MTDVKVEQCDRDAAAAMMEAYQDRLTPEDQASSAALCVNIRAGLHDGAPRVQAFARHRQAAEKAQQERDAAYIEGKGGVIPGATVFVSLITGENMPCMSGDARDKLNPHKRRQFDDATRDLATAIRSQGHE